MNTQSHPASKLSGARQLDPTHAIVSAFPARFLKPWHLTNNGFDTFTDTVVLAQMEPVTADDKHVEHKLVLYFDMAKTPYLVSAKTDVTTLKSRYGVSTFGDLAGLRLTIEIVRDRRHGERLRIKPTPPNLSAASEIGAEIGDAQGQDP